MAIDPNDPEYRASRTVPSTYSNRAYVTVNGPLVRIAFGEAQNPMEESQYYSAVTMSKTDAQDLAYLILNLIKQTAPPAPPAPLGGLGNAMRGPPGVRR